MSETRIITVEDLEAADGRAIQAGYIAWAPDALPPATASPSFLLGWRNAQAEATGVLDEDQRLLAAAIAADDQAIAGAREASALLRVEPRFPDEGFSMGKKAA